MPQGQMASVRILRNTEWRNNTKSVQTFLENLKGGGNSPIIYSA